MGSYKGMENGGSEKWKFKGNKALNATSISVRGVLNMLMDSINNATIEDKDKKQVIRLCRVDPTDNPLFRTTNVAPRAMAEAVESFNFNNYPPTVGLPNAKRAIANYLSSDHPYKLSPEDVFITVGGTQAIDIIIPVLARPGANILLPRPGYPQYHARSVCSFLEVRYFDLLPERRWEVDLDSLQDIADENTVAMVLINPSNPCGNVFTFQHLKKVAETARKLGICIICDEVYAHVAFGSNSFVSMGVFSSIVPVIIIGALAKRWLVPGWRIGWIGTCDPHGIFKKTGVLKSIMSYLEITTDPPTFMQAAIPQILETTKPEFHLRNLDMMREAANIFYDMCKEIPCLTCPHKPEGAMATMVEIDFSKVKGIVDDVDFCVKMAKEEFVLLLPGVTVGLKNWLRISLAVSPSDLKEGLRRLKTFSLRHANM